MLRGVAIAVPAVLAGCIEIPGPAVSPDAETFCGDDDGDLWLMGTTGDCLDGRPLDCDDTDPARHPGAAELGDDTSDQDCDRAPWDGTGAIAPIVWGLAGGDLEVDIGALALEFDSVNGHALRTLELGASGQLLYTGEIQERHVGVEAWQQFFSYAPGGDDRAVVVDTPAVLRLQVDWADGGMTGTTLWTLHAGGRMFRREALTVDSGASISNVTAYQALNGAAFGRIDWETNPGAPVEITFGVTQFWANTIGQTPWLCAFPAASAELELGMLSRPDAGSATTRSARISANRDGQGADQVALQYDWTTAQPGQPATYGGSFQMIATESIGTSCNQVAAAAVAWASPPALIARGGVLMTAPAGEDQNGDLYAEGGGYWTVRAQASPLELELASAGAVWGLSTVRILDLPAGDPVIDRVEGDTVGRLVRGRDYLLERDEASGDHWLVTLAMPGDVLRVVSP